MKVKECPRCFDVTTGGREEGRGEGRGEGRDQSRSQSQAIFET